MNQTLILTSMIIMIIVSIQYSSVVHSLSVQMHQQAGSTEHHKRHHRDSPNMWTILGQIIKSDNSEQSTDYSDENSIRDRPHNKRNDNLNNNLNSTGSESASTNSASSSSSSSTNPPNIVTHCPKCRPELRVTEQQLTELRIKYVKNQILEKLKLKERPQVSISDLPKPVAEGVTIMLNEEENSVAGIPDEYYGKTTQKIIFPEIDSEHCREMEELGSSMCFSIKIPDDIDYMDIDSAELWLYKQPHIMDLDKHTFLIGEVEAWNSKKVIKPFAIHETNVTEEWVKIDIAWQIRRWIEYKDLYHVIDISCSTCENDPAQNLFSLDNGYRPFIVVNTHSDRKVKRQKRSVNCSAGVTECCRERLYISFADIGWDDWILHPPGYHAYFCRGSCSPVSSLALSGTHYNSVIRKVIYKQNEMKTKSLELVPCCTGTQFSSLQLFYMDSNNTATQKTLPNMVVEACGCM